MKRARGGIEEFSSGRRESAIYILHTHADKVCVHLVRGGTHPRDQYVLYRIEYSIHTALLSERLDPVLGALLQVGAAVRYREKKDLVPRYMSLGR